jgi:hypothetical protein
MKGAPDPKIRQECEEAFRIRRREGFITARPILSGFNSPPDAVNSRPLLTRLAGAYLDAKARGDEREAEPLLRLFFDLCDHALDQGFAEGCIRHCRLRSTKQIVGYAFGGIAD